MTSDVTFGLGMLTAQRPPDDPRSDAEVYADLLDLCAYAEEVGFDSVWLSEHHFVDDGYMSGVLPVAAAIAARTRTIRIATGVLVAPLHDPLRLAEDAATVDVLSAGRLLLGLGAGYRPEEFTGLGRDLGARGADLDRALEILRAAWTTGRAPAAGDAPVVVTPAPHRPGGPPVWIGARTAAGIRRAARHADGLLAARVTPEEFGDVVRRLREEAARAGRDPAELSVGVHCPVLAWPGGGAWDVVEKHLFYSEWKYGDMMREPYGTRGVAVDVPELDERRRAALRVGAIVGEPEEVAEGVRRYLDAAGPGPVEFVPRLYWPGMEPARQREVVGVFATEVVPRLRAGLADVTGAVGSHREGA